MVEALQARIDTLELELREARDQQIATAEVLQVINSSPGDLAPVFEAMLEKAMRLCEAAFGQLDIHDGERFRTAAVRGVPAPFAEYREQNPPTYGPGTIKARLLAGERVVHITDLKAEAAYLDGEPNRRALVDLGGARSAVNVPLIKHGAVLGFIMIYRQEVRPFTGKQIALLQNFAAQAVIAIESARLVTETREALEQQTATSEVLQVINASPGDLAPIFDAMLEKAIRLSEAAFGVLYILSGELCYGAATRNFPPELEDLVRKPFKPSGDGFVQKALRGEAVEHVTDLDAAGIRVTQDPRVRAYVDLG